jgi:hypothetical protein
MFKLEVKSSVWFDFNIVCGGSSQILLGSRGHGVFNTFSIIWNFFEHRLTSEYGDISVSYLPVFDVNV